jgi:GTP-sensing pleiotropic transcriptional regulator CodY
LREFRLTGDLDLLKKLIDKAIEIDESANTLNLTNDFYSSLTDNENLAFSSIVETLSSQNGYISVVKMIQKANVSRPVFTNLLQKMEKFNIALIKNCGAKGTYIEWRVEV